MFRLLLIPLVLIALLIGAMAWSGDATPKRADFTFVNRGEISTLDPRRMSWLEDIRVGYALWEGLYALDPQTLDPVPGAAGKIDISEDKTVYTFHLREDGLWSNGNPVVANDFVFAWRRMLQEPGDYTYLLHFIKGAEAYETAFGKGERPDFFKAVGVEIIDPRTLRVTLNHPVTFFPDVCAFPPLFPLHAASMKPFAREENGITTFDRGFTRPPNLVTNGPYRLDRWDFKRRVRLVANEHYWDRANVKSKVIEMLMIEDKLASFLAYENGSVDWIAEITGDIAAELKQAGRSDIKIFPAFGSYFYILNCQEKLPDGRPNPLRDVRVRRALAMSIDKQPIVDTITRLSEPVATDYIPPGAFKGYHSPAGIPFDIAGAKKLLAEAGYDNGRGFPSLELVFNTEMQHGEIAQYVRRQWQRNLGIDVTLASVERSIFADRRHNKEFHIARGSWFGDYNDPSTFTDVYLSNSGNNDAGWLSKEYDALCEKAARESDADKRLRLFEQAEGMLLDQAAIIPIFTYVNKCVVKPNVKGLPLNARFMVNFKSVVVER